MLIFSAPPEVDGAGLGAIVVAIVGAMMHGCVDIGAPLPKWLPYPMLETDCSWKQQNGQNLWFGSASAPQFGQKRIIGWKPCESIAFIGDPPAAGEVLAAA
mmetsp:Transcript_32045/g.91390  ORF Transcript_32045/g.91390 Transcript_32045/m.91390 type:complete len:101 (+) Transcript_32045:426-728(+)